MSNSYAPDHVTFLRGFPPEFEHRGDLDPRGLLGPLQTARRIRIVPMPSPDLLEALCLVIIRKAPFRVSPKRASEIIQALLDRIEGLLRAHPEGDPSLRTLRSDDIRQILTLGRRGSGTWRRGAEVLAGRTQWRWGTDSPTDQEIFAHERFWRNEYIIRAQETLFSERAVIVTGPVSSGKSTICKYLIFEFTKRFPQAASYHLSVQPGAELGDELSFFKDNLDMEVLFVIDDEQHATHWVASLVQAFLAPTARALLVIGSTRTYSRTQASRYESPLHELPSVTIEAFEPDEIRSLLACDLPGRLELTDDQTDFLAEAKDASNGRVGMVLLLAHCFRDMPTRKATIRLLITGAAKRAVRQLLVNALKSELADHDGFEQRILPVLLVASQVIGVPMEIDREVVGMLCDSGILTPIPSDGGERYRASDEALSFVLERQYRELLIDHLRQYLQNFPDELRVVCCSLAAHRFGRQILRNLINDSELDFVMLLQGELERDLEGGAAVLSAIGMASPDLSRRVLRNTLTPHRQVNPVLAARIVELRTPDPLETGKALFGSIRRLDRTLVRVLFESVVGATELTNRGYILLRGMVVRLTAEETRLADALSFIIALRQCHFAFGKAVFDTFVSLPVYRRQVESLLPASSDSIADIVDSCGPLRLLSHDKFGDFATEALQEKPLRQAVTGLSNARAALRLMRDLRRVYPRLAIDVVWGIWHSHRNWFSMALHDSADVVDGVSVLRSLASVDKRIAIQFARSEQDFLSYLAFRAPDHHRLASALRVVYDLEPQLAARMAAQIDADELTARLNDEQHRIALVGRSLTNYAAILPPLSLQLIVGLDLSSLYKRISPRAFLYNFVFLTRGVLDAKLSEPHVTPKEAIADFMDRLNEDSNVTDQLKEIMAEQRDIRSRPLDLREIALAFSQLLEAGLSMDDLLRLYGIANAKDLLARIRTWVRAAADVLGIRQLLYAMLLLPDLSYAEEGLTALMDVVRAPDVGSTVSETLNPVNSNARSSKDRLSPAQEHRGREIADIAEIGDLLRLATMIDDRQAPTLLNSFGDRLLGQFRRDRNLGRQATFLQGLNEASRAACQRLVKEAFGEGVKDNHLIEMLDENEKLENILHLIEQVEIVDAGAADRILRLGIASGQGRLLALAGVDANLQNLSRWLRCLHRHPTAAPDEFQEEVFQLMVEQRQYDERLVSAIEATMALIDVDRFDRASTFVSDVIRSAKQARSIRSAKLLIDQSLKLIRIDQAMNTSCLKAVLTELPDSNLAMALQARAEPALLGFLHWLIRNYIPELALDREKFLADARTDLSGLLGRLRVTPLTTIARILLEEPLAIAQGCIRDVNQEALVKWRPWEIGLVETVWEAVGGAPSRTLIDPADFWNDLDDQRCVIAEERNIYFGPDTSNIKFGLSMRSKVDNPEQGPLADTIRHRAAARLQNETQNAVRRLLDVDFPAKDLAKYPYYFKVLLADIAFVPYRFDWTERIATEVHGSIFETSL
jgi:hypothetical protein